ncbi:MAG: hypothetical protein KatS3mg108_1008 [Isosphaeraceae bacterium]|jgi:hypothetical protein|nr:MAG: hypothetical protein KatS3mg108_1008 [Isosphaeraceae bacterium]
MFSAVIWVAALALGLGVDDAPIVPVGLAKRDITPATPIRLTGYGSRTAEADQIDQRLWARAVAIGDQPVVLVTLDLCGVPGPLVEEAARQLETEVGLRRDRLAVTVTHTHTGPAVTGFAPMIFAEDLTPDEERRIDQYSRGLVPAIVGVARAALDNRRPSRLGYACGRVDFAVNRRVIRDGRWTGFGVNPSGPVDRTLPVLRVTGPEGDLRGVVAGYACHCTTLDGDYNAVCGDWATDACEQIEASHPEAQALIVIGCAADANPEPRGGPEQRERSRRHGAAVVAEVDRLLKAAFESLPAPSATAIGHLELPFQPIPDRRHWEAEAQKPGQVGRRARFMLSVLDSGQSIPTTLPYTIQSWSFGDRLTLVFLAGEVVVDYALRLRAERPERTLWPIAYANDVCCYIPSQRILSEGGYEADSSMIYYNRPASLAPSIEDQIIQAVLRLIPD